MYNDDLIHRLERIETKLDMLLDPVKGVFAIALEAKNRSETNRKLIFGLFGMISTIVSFALIIAF